MRRYSTLADRDAVEQEMAWEARERPATMHDMMARAAQKYGARPAISFQLFSDPTAPAETLTWAELHGRVIQGANLLRELGIGPRDTVAYLMPNATEAVVALLAGATAGIANPINPLLDAENIAGILRDTGATVLITLKAFPKTDIAQKAAEAVAMAPNVKTVLEVDLNRYLTAPKKWLVPLLRPKVKTAHHARVMDFNAAMDAQPAHALTFDDPKQDRVASYFHTGGTTGIPKVAQHKISGMVYNGWLGSNLLFSETDVLICPLPMFHVFAAYPILMSAIMSGAHVVFPTPAGYRGDGVFDHFWKLVERYKVTFLITVPTAIAALMQRPVNADISSLRIAISGSAPLPIELYNRFKEATGVEIAEGYGLTEATCLVAVNPPDGQKKVGSVGYVLPYSHVRILRKSGEGFTECPCDEVGEICVASPGVFEGSTYTEAVKNHDLFAEDRFLRTGDLGRIDPDGFLWITGRAKDLIIRGGHNIDPAQIEDPLMAHPEVAFAGAIGQPDAFAGELPCVYVELVKDATVTEAELLDYIRTRIHERAAMPKHLEILEELPKTAVGKIFKPDLRKRAIKRVLNKALAEAGLPARIHDVVDHKKRGLTAQVTGAGDAEALTQCLGQFSVAWDRVREAG
ncbi:acyl-CoA synthetase [Thioclava sp. SK-1]|uniref:acyl-CoA synthetase n=1 Tax=Thioclava sp. SK-1 TaxID=1889770 RepID=UPI00082673D6|nr:acyl-CoA synthetase [Thioclava sp. SK-1]OCX66898.1 acyl-CoA synthetase [Thioclava sp. SK-1]